MRVVIYATAAVEGGALSVLKDLLNYLNDDGNYYTLCINRKIKNDLDISKNINVISIDTKNIFKRLFFDFFGFRRKFKNHNYDGVINLQNIPVRTDLKQFLYIHQPIPFSNETFSLFKRSEHKLLMYKHLYGYLIKINSKYINCCLVQTEWMKSAVSDKLGINRKKIHIIKPNIDIDFNRINKKNDDVRYFIYPAASYSYKNHRLLVEALNLIDRKVLDNNSVKLLITIEKNKMRELSDAINEYSLDKYLDFIGHLPRYETLNLIANSMGMLFPSKLETYGVPLVEAAKLNKTIVASDLPYAREVLANYQNVIYCNPSNPQQWAEIIENIVLRGNNKISEEFITESGWDKLKYILGN